VPPIGFDTQIDSQTFPVIPGSQVTDSENHPGWNDSHPNGDVGGNFYSQKRFIVINGNDNHPRRFGFDIGVQGIKENYSYDGPVFPVAPSVNDLAARFPSSGEASTAELDKLGTTAISRTEPTNNVINLTTFLGEILREGIPRAKFDLWKERTGDLKQLRKAAGDDYLNVQFGWKPLLADITDFMSGVRNLNKLINQYKRDAGRQVRRRYSFPPVQSFSESVVLENATVAIVGGGRNSLLDSTRRGQVVRSRETTVRRWFSGAFTYHLPDPGSWQSEHSGLAAKFLGVDITPETLWELAPWSWAVDWFTNVGDLIHNANRWSADGLVLRYGYVMEHSVVRDTYTHIGGNGFVSINANVFPEAYTFCTETKLRRRATPFGFGVNLSALTSQQNAIIAALGLSHLR